MHVSVDDPSIAGHQPEADTLHSDSAGGFGGPGGTRTCWGGLPGCGPLLPGTGWAPGPGWPAGPAGFPVFAASGIAAGGTTGFGFGGALRAASARRAAASAAVVAAAVCELLLSNDRAKANCSASTKWIGAAGSNSEFFEVSIFWASCDDSTASVACSCAATWSPAARLCRDSANATSAEMIKGLASSG